MLRAIISNISSPISSTIYFIKNIPKIYTRKGDRGSTYLVNGLRQSKSHPIFHLLGDIDELNSQIGLCNCLVKNDKLKDSLYIIQNHLYHIGAYLASKDPKKLVAKELDKRMEVEIDEMTEKMPPLNRLIHPGGSIEASHLHIARTIARRVERKYVAYGKQNVSHRDLLIFFNRLSDFLFVAARYENHLQGIKDVISV